MTTFRNTNYIKRDYETTNVVACVAAAAPGPNWEPADESVLSGLQSLWLANGVRYYGYL
jgi:hypothetical protein